MGNRTSMSDSSHTKTAYFLQIQMSTEKSIIQFYQVVLGNHILLAKTHYDKVLKKKFFAIVNISYAQFLKYIINKY